MITRLDGDRDHSSHHDTELEDIRPDDGPHATLGTRAPGGHIAPGARAQRPRVTLRLGPHRHSARGWQGAIDGVIES